MFNTQQFVQLVHEVYFMHVVQGMPYCEIEEYIYGERTHTLYYMMRMSLARRALNS